MAKKKASDKLKVSDIKLFIEEVKALMSKHGITNNNYVFTADGPKKIKEEK